MKRSLFIAIVVLLMAALFVSCNAEKSMKDELVEVRISADESRALSASGTMDAANIVGNLYWYYSATKTSGPYTTGVTEWAAVKTGEKGLSGGNLGEDDGFGNKKMSKGGWSFSFYGYETEQTTKPSDPKAEAVYCQEALAKNIYGTITLEINLGRGEGALPAAEVTFAQSIAWAYSGAQLSANEVITLKVYDGADLKITKEAAFGTEYTFAFAATDKLTLSEGPHTLHFVVYDQIGNDEPFIVGQSDLVITAKDGMKYVVTDIDGIDEVDDSIAVTTGVPSVPVLGTDTVTAVSNASTTASVNNTPAGATNKATTVLFPAGSFEGTKEIAIETSSAAVASANFAVTDGSATVAALSISIADGTSTFNNNAVTVTTFIEKGLDGVTVVYNGTGAAPTEVHYDPETGELSFKTTHFSEFIVKSTSAAKIGSRAYGTFDAALAAVQNGETITLLQAVSKGYWAPDGKQFTLDLNGTTWNGWWAVDKADVTFNNGKINGIIYMYGQDNDGSKCHVTVGANATTKGIYLFQKDSGTTGYGMILDVYGKLESYIFVLGNIAEGDSVINLYNGAKIESQDNGICLNGNATVNVYEGASIIVQDETAIEVRAGVLNIYGGKFESNGEFVCTPNGSGTTTKGPAIAIAQHNTKLPIDVTINGGEFKGYYALYEANPQNNADADLAKISLTINGGTFTCALGRSPITVEDAEKLTLVIGDKVVTKNEIAGVAGDPVQGDPFADEE